MAIIQPLYRQSNKDLCLQGYGSIDRIVKMCRDNNIESINTPNTTPYFFDENFIVDRNVTGYKYATRYIAYSPFIYNYIAQDGAFYIGQDGAEYITEV